jgi:hypothetical protein
VIYKETHLDGGIAWNTLISPDSLYFYTSMSHYYHETNYSSPALAKLDLAGNVLGVYDVVYGYTEGKLSAAQFLNDSILAAIADWGNTDDSLWSRAVIIDTLGNLLNSTILMEDLYTSILQVTYDGKLLYASNTYQNGQFDCYLTKLNQDLDDDTIYTAPFTYDSLCPYQIVSDTIVQDDCDLIVGIEDNRNLGHSKGQVVELDLWPIPCSNVLNISLTSHQPIESWTIQIYDVYGRLVKEEYQSPYFVNGEKEANWKIDVSNLPIGLYLVTVIDGQTMKASSKFLVAK